jgi:hypothetical protein
VAKIPNPHNGYVPKVGEPVKVIGACHPALLGKVVEVTAVDPHGLWAETKYEHPVHGEVYTSGELGGLEPVKESP